MENFQSIDEKNRYCLFQLWLKIVNFFTIFFFVLINVVIVGWIVIKTNDFKTFFRNFDVSHTINYLNNLPLNSNFFVKDFTGIIILVGLFVAYCYFFDYIKNKGLNFDEESENKGKMFSSFIFR